MTTIPLALDDDQSTHLQPNPVWSNDDPRVDDFCGPVNQPAILENIAGANHLAAQPSVGRSHNSARNNIASSSSSLLPLSYHAPDARVRDQSERVPYLQQTHHHPPRKSANKIPQPYHASGSLWPQSLSSRTTPAFSASAQHSPHTSIGTSSLSITPYTLYQPPRQKAFIDAPAFPPAFIPAQPTALEAVSSVGPPSTTPGYLRNEKKRKAGHDDPSNDRIRRRLIQEEPQDRPFPLQPIMLPHLLNIPPISPEPVFPTASGSQSAGSSIPSDEEDRPAVVAPVAAAPAKQRRRAKRKNPVEATQSPPEAQPEAENRRPFVCHIKRVDGQICGEELVMESKIIRKHFNKKHVGKEEFIWPKTISDCPFPCLEGKGPCRSNSTDQMCMSVFVKHLLEQHDPGFEGAMCPTCDKTFTRLYSVTRHVCKGRQVLETVPPDIDAAPPGIETVPPDTETAPLESQLAGPSRYSVAYG